MGVGANIRRPGSIGHGMWPDHHSCGTAPDSHRISLTFASLIDKPPTSVRNATTASERDEQSLALRLVAKDLAECGPVDVMLAELAGALHLNRIQPDSPIKNDVVRRSQIVTE